MPIARQDLLTALDAVKGSVAVKTFMPILTHVLVDKDTVLGFDSEMGCRVRMAHSVGCTFNVKFDVFHGLLAKLTGDEVNLRIIDDKLNIECGSHHSKLTQMTEVFPKPQLKLKKDSWVTVPPGFTEALQRAKTAVASDKDTAYSGVFIDGPSVFSTDRVRLVRCTLDMNAPRMLLSVRTVEEVIRLGAPTKFTLTENGMVVFDYLNLTLIAKTKELQAVEVFQGMAKFFDKRDAIETIPEGLQEALVRLSLFSPKDAPTAKARSDGQSLDFETLGECGSSSESIKRDGGEFPSKMFNPVKLHEGLKYAEGMDWGQGVDDLIYARGETAGYEFLLAPMR